MTNVQIKPNSNIASHIAMGVLKGFLSRAYKICTEKQDFLIGIFRENGHNRNALTNIAREYLRNINKPKSNDQNNNKKKTS